MTTTTAWAASDPAGPLAPMVIERRPVGTPPTSSGDPGFRCVIDLSTLEAAS